MENLAGRPVTKEVKMAQEWGLTPVQIGHLGRKGIVRMQIMTSDARQILLNAFKKSQKVEVVPRSTNVNL